MFLGFGGLGFRVSGLGHVPWLWGFWISGLGFRVECRV